MTPSATRWGNTITYEGVMSLQEVYFDTETIGFLF